MVLGKIVVERFNKWKFRAFKFSHRIDPFVGVYAFLSKNRMQSQCLRDWKVAFAFDKIVYGSFKATTQMKQRVSEYEVTKLE
jgi:hypothetical protein